MRKIRQPRYNRDGLRNEPEMPVDTDVLTWLMESLIAATAIEHQLPVLTANVKHFAAVSGLRIGVFVP